MSVQATSSSLAVELRYSSDVNAVATCTDSCRTGHAVARVKLGKKLLEILTYKIHRKDV